jgi:hypothetical protein
MTLPTTILVVIAIASVARADSMGQRPDERGAIKHAESVVVGAFTGATVKRTIEQRNAIDASGKPYTARLEVIAHELVVSELLDGPPVPETISILVPGALSVPAPRRRVVVGLRAEGDEPQDGYNLVYGRALEADTDAQLAQVRELVKAVRASVPVDPRAIADAVGMREAELQPEEPAVPGPPGPDDPNGPQPPSYVGTPQSAPRVIEPRGDPRHPPEPVAMDAAAASEPAGASRRSSARDTRAPTATGGARDASAASSPRRWPVFAAAALLAVVAGAWSRRARR